MKDLKTFILYFLIGSLITLFFLTGCSTTEPYCSNGYEKCIQRKGNEVCYCKEYK